MSYNLCKSGNFRSTCAFQQSSLDLYIMLFQEKIFLTISSNHIKWRSYFSPWKVIVWIPAPNTNNSCRIEFQTITTFVEFACSFVESCAFIKCLYNIYNKTSNSNKNILHKHIRTPTSNWRNRISVDLCIMSIITDHILLPQF